jgi:hypothetical protein
MDPIVGFSIVTENSLQEQGILDSDYIYIYIYIFRFAFKFLILVFYETMEVLTRLSYCRKKRERNIHIYTKY